jgi:CRISPR-associated protein (TIGR03986 family)
VAQDDGLEKREVAYEQGKSLRGRKVYPHHNIPVNLEQSYWGNPLEDRTQQALDSKYFQEYRRPKKDGQEQRDNQNRSIRGWVKPGKRFAFTIDINNLSDVEAGALLWLLNLPKDHYHRLGGGKPFGFGSVKLSLIEIDLRDGEAWRTYYRSLMSTTTGAQRISSVADAGEKLIKVFKQAVVDAYPNPAKSFDQVSFIAAFLRAAKGFEDGLPIHYPRSQATPHPDGEAFQWFVANEKVERGRVRYGYALGDLATDKGLPILIED